MVINTLIRSSVLCGVFQVGHQMILDWIPIIKLAFNITCIHVTCMYMHDYIDRTSDLALETELIRLPLC